MWLGNIELARARHYAARAYFRRALTTGFRNAEAHHGLALALLGLEDEVDAREHFTRAKKGGIESARGELTLATAAIEAEKAEQALGHLAAAARRARIDGDATLYAEALTRGKELAEDPAAFEEKAGPPPTPQR